MAGDVSDDGEFSARWCGELRRRTGKPVLFVPGNHEYYGARMPRRLQAMHRACQQEGVVLLHNRMVTLGGVHFAGATPWTDFHAAGAAMQPIAMRAARNSIADFSVTFFKEQGRVRLLEPWDTVRLHQRALRTLEVAAKLSWHHPVVVVTHHAPALQSIHPRYAGNLLNAAYASDLERLIGNSNIRLWVHGHMHNSVDYTLGETRVVCNPRGTACAPNRMFDPHQVVAI